MRSSYPSDDLFKNQITNKYCKTHFKPGLGVCTTLCVTILVCVTLALSVVWTQRGVLVHSKSSPRRRKIIETWTLSRSVGLDGFNPLGSVEEVQVTGRDGLQGQ